MSETQPRIVVIAMDGSNISNNAFAWYLERIRQPGDRVVFIHCPEQTSMQTLPFSMGNIDAAAEADMRKALSEDRAKMTELNFRLEGMLADAKVDGKVLMGRGSPGEVVVRMAVQENASLIITGSRGLGAIRKTFLGSVSDYIMQHSLVPVLVYRDGA